MRDCTAVQCMPYQTWLNVLYAAYLSHDAAATVFTWCCSYTPFSNISSEVTDNLTYTVMDQRGGYATGLISVAISKLSDLAGLLPVCWMSGYQLVLTVSLYSLSRYAILQDVAICRFSPHTVRR